MKEEINLLEFWDILRKNRKTLFFIILFLTLASFVYGFVVPKEYRSQAVLMPLGGSSDGFSAQLSGVSQFLGLNAGGGSGSDRLMAFLKSRTMGEVIVKENDLMHVFFGKYDETRDITPLLEGGIAKLRRMSFFSETPKLKTIVISVENEDPQLAARLVESYIENLRHFIQTSTLTTSKKNRVFIEEQLENNKKQLLEVGKRLNLFYREGVVSSVLPMLDVPLSVEEELSEELQENFAGLKTTGNSLEDFPPKKLGAVVKAVPQQVYLEYLTSQKGILINVNSLLSSQYELAKIKETEEEPAFQVLDAPRVPVGPFKPNRKLIFILGFFTACLFAILFVFFRAYIQDLKGQRNVS